MLSYSDTSWKITRYSLCPQLRLPRHDQQSPLPLRDGRSTPYTMAQGDLSNYLTHGEMQRTVECVRLTVLSRLSKSGVARNCRHCSLLCVAVCERVLNAFGPVEAADVETHLQPMAAAVVELWSKLQFAGL